MARIFGKKLEQVLGQPRGDREPQRRGRQHRRRIGRPRRRRTATPCCSPTSGILSANASLYKKINFDPVKDFAPITLVGAQANVLVVHPSLPAHTLAELIAHAKANPGKMNSCLRRPRPRRTSPPSC